MIKKHVIFFFILVENHINFCPTKISAGKLHVDIHSRDFFLYPDITNSREYFITWKCFTQINYISPQERYNV